MLKAKYILAAIVTKAADVAVTYYGVKFLLGREQDPLWQSVNINPEVMLIGFAAVSLWAVFCYLVQPYLVNGARDRFVEKCIDYSVYIIIIVNLSVTVWNINRMLS